MFPKISAGDRVLGCLAMPFIILALLFDELKAKILGKPDPLDFE